MVLDISIKEDSVEEAEKKKKKDITLWSREVLEDRYKKKQKFFKYFAILLIVMAAMMLYTFYNLINTQDELYNTQDSLRTCISDTLKTCPAVNGTITGTSNTLVTGITDFFKWITHIDQPYFYKIMILLGILYLVQIVFAVVTDIVEVVLLIFVLIKRGVMAVIGLFRNKDKGGKK